MRYRLQDYIDPHPAHAGQYRQWFELKATYEAKEVGVSERRCGLMLEDVGERVAARGYPSVLILIKGGNAHHWRLRRIGTRW